MESTTHTVISSRWNHSILLIDTKEPIMTITLHPTTPLKYLLPNPMTCTAGVDSMYHVSLSEDQIILHIARTNTDTNDLKLEWYIKCSLPGPSIIRAIYVVDGKLYVVANNVDNPLELVIHVTDVETTANSYFTRHPQLRKNLYNKKTHTISVKPLLTNTL